MHSLHIGKYFYPFSGGIENFILDLIPALHRYGVASSVLVHKSPREQPVAAGGLRIDGLHELQRVASLGQLTYAPISPGYGQALAAIIADTKPDLLHLHLPNTSAFWALAHKLARAAYFIQRDQVPFDAAKLFG